MARFQVATTNPKALYKPDGDMLGPAEILALTVPAQTHRTFYGTLDMAYSAGAWTGPTTIENPAAKLGKPLDFYTVPTLILGSNQYKQAVAQLDQGLATQRTVAAKTKLALATIQSQKQLVALQQQIQAEQQAVAAPVKLAQETVDSQKQIIALQQQLLTNDVTMASLRTKLAKRMETQLDSFEGTWGGSLRCEENPWRIRAAQMELKVTKKVGGMLDGQLTVIGGDIGINYYGKIRLDNPIPASLQVMNVDENGPVKLNILSAGKTGTEKQFLNFEVQLTPSGALRGNLVHEAKVCSVIFSR